MNWETYEIYKNMATDQRALYNGYTVAQIKANMNPAMLPTHKSEYLKNVNTVIEYQTAKKNLEQIDSLKYRNFIITNYYL